MLIFRVRGSFSVIWICHDPGSRQATDDHHHKGNPLDDGMPRSFPLVDRRGRRDGSELWREGHKLFASAVDE